MQRYVILVLSVPRGGGSALAGALAKAGAHPGTNLVASAADAPSGNWECAPLVRLNDRLLLELSARWDSMAPLSGGWPTLPAIQALRPEASRAIAAELGGAKLAVLKDPRLCRLLPFWRDALAEAGYTVSCVLMLRRPMEVAASLSRRNQFAPEKSLTLWLTHIADAERDSRELPRATLTYDALLADPQAALARVCDDAAFPMKSTTTQRSAAIDQVRPDLKRHHHGGPNKPLREAMASGLDLALDAGYSKLAELPAGRDPRGAVEALVSSTLPALAIAVPPWVAAELAATQAVGQLRAQEIDAARRRIDELTSHIDTARTAHAARDGEMATLRARTDELKLAKRELAKARDALRAADAARNAIEAAARAAHDSDAASLRVCTDLLATARRELAEVKEVRRAAIAEFDALRAAEREQRELAGRLQHELGEERGAVARLTGQINQAREAAEARERLIESANRQIADLVGQLEMTRHAHVTNEAREAVLQRQFEAARHKITATDTEGKSWRGKYDDAAAKLSLLSIEAEVLRHDLAALDGKHRQLAGTAIQAQQAVVALTAELELRTAAERDISADRTRLAQLEREARERIAMTEARLAELISEARGLTERLGMATAKLARLDGHWLGRLAKRVTRSE
jgi:hypothetical protein